MRDRNSETKISAMRINARNLRAKVRSMLPSDVCCKYLDRNVRLEKLQHKKNHWDEKHQIKATENRDLKYWTNSHSSSTQFFSEKFQKVQPRHMFSKLTKGQVQQICDHKHYFIGEAHISDFDDFMNPLQTLHKSSPIHDKSKSDKQGSKRPFKHLCDTVKTITPKHPSFDEKWFSTQVRIKDLKEQDNSNLATQRLILQLRQRRANNNLFKLKENRSAKFLLKRSKQLECELKMQNKKRCMKESQEINLLASQLKNIVCFHKKKEIQW